MRKDMFKVLVERPRCGARFKLNRQKLAGEDDLPTRIGVRRHRCLNGTRSKYLNEHLGPLKRYLMRQVGRPWDRVYSEICENLNADNIVMRHVLLHLEDYVATKVVADKDGDWMDGEWPRSRRPGVRAWSQPLYVDPVDGILKRSDRLWKKLGLNSTPWTCKPPTSNPDVKKLDATRELRRIHGIWYDVSFGRDKRAAAQALAFDALTHEPVPAARRHALTKRQLSSAELKARGLENEAGY